MYNRKEKLIVLTNYEELTKQFGTVKSRTREGVLCSPILLNEKHCLPLGWEKELEKENIKYTIDFVEWFEEEIK